MKARLAVAGLLGCFVLVAGFEGLRTTAYRDPVGIPTICYGSTAGVRVGDVATRAQCEALLWHELLAAHDAMMACVRVPLTPGQRGAFTSFTFNVGAGAFCRSTLARRLNARDYAGACAELSRWVHARGIRLPGLERRRAAERALCERPS
ncbi:lysozyme [Solimonas sp. SE-A11]|uniref:lysozyme n=1 Tax=Solimonas sp. SE-A11 TaxID=3054954 RepID=UPI00259D078C|nr:lysozyme [Solimonas sp. SE-A11]MDM4772751.1 lysozyme [Solimonas sp. SE-A11]